MIASRLDRRKVIPPTPVDNTPFITTWDSSITGDLSSNANTVRLPLVSNGTYFFRVQWGDGSEDIISAWDQAEKNHVYATPGVYTITINGLLDGWSFNPTKHNYEPEVNSDFLKVTALNQWGDPLVFSSRTEYFFYSCSNMDASGVTDFPDLTGVTTIEGMFIDCNVGTVANLASWDVSTVTNFNSVFEGHTYWNNPNFNDSGVTSWDVSSATTMENMFKNCTVFNQDLSSWNVTNVNSFRGLFWGCVAANNLNVGGWNVSNATIFAGMFQKCESFAEDLTTWNMTGALDLSEMFAQCLMVSVPGIPGWDVSTVTNFFAMFSSCDNFNQDISGWTTTSATDMSYMFSNCWPFNQDVSGWDMTNVTNISGMFQDCYDFNQPVGNWNITSAMTDISFCFSWCLKFNQDLSSWNTSNVFDIGGTFKECREFNGNITTWDTTNVSNAHQMFTGAWVFNQNISGWNITNKLTGMSSMFYNAYAFNQDISGWDVSSVTSFQSVLRNTTAFQGDVSGWVVTSADDFYFFLAGKTTANYPSSLLDAIYNTWSGLALPSGMTFDAGSIQYTSAGQAGRDILTGTYGWTINDGGLV